MELIINDEEALEELLSRPSDADATAAATIDGDVFILGAGGKMGPSLAKLAARANRKAGTRHKVLAASRFHDEAVRRSLEQAGVETIACDLLDRDDLANLPDAPNVIFLAARKFGTSGSEWLTWAMNTYLPALVAERFRRSRLVSFSTGNVYPLCKMSSGGATEATELAPAGEYAQSALGRERLLQYMSEKWNSPVAILRLNYANDLRYGVLADIARAVYERRPVDLSMSLVNVIWQGDANSMCLRSLLHCSSPPFVVNVSGPETLSVRYLAEQFAARFGIEPELTGAESDSALLTNAAKAHQIFGYPSVTARQLIDWTAHWIAAGGRSLNKPTHFEVRDGRF
jgi:dTDP-4-dehydrorhamnose reductase